MVFNLPSTTDLTYQDLAHWQLLLIDQLNSYVLEYIAIATSIIFALGAVFYFFTVRPYEKELERQATDIKDSKKSLGEKIDTEIVDIKKEFGELAKKITQDSVLALNQKEDEILKKAVSESQLAIANEKSALVNEIRKLEERLGKVETLQATQRKDIQALQSTQTSHKTLIDDIDITMREFETFKYSKEGRMGAIIIPVETISKLIGTKDEWRIPYWLETLRDEIFPEMPVERTVSIRELLTKLPQKYDDLKGQIDEKLRTKPSDKKASV